ncbi:MAG: ABC transporter permease subunit [Acholeplasmataceae bacterium]|nr:ABC transporter permease subunit [Acholeplasmataceae bacterium]
MVKKYTIQLSAVFILFLVWIALYYVINQPLLMPSLFDTSIAFSKLFYVKSSIFAWLNSLFRLILILMVSGFLGIILGAISSVNKKIEIFMTPYVTILRTIPVISIIVILMILFGFRSTPYIVTFFMVFPIVYQQTLDSIKSIEPAYLDVYHLEDHHFLNGLRYCYLPLTGHHILTGLLQSAGLGFKVLVMTEYLSQTPHSIGQALYISKINLQYDFVFAWTIWMIIVSVFIEFLIRKLQHKIIL